MIVHTHYGYLTPASVNYQLGDVLDAVRRYDDVMSPTAITVPLRIKESSATSPVVHGEAILRTAPWLLNRRFVLLETLASQLHGMFVLLERESRTERYRAAEAVFVPGPNYQELNAYARFTTPLDEILRRL